MKDYEGVLAPGGALEGLQKARSAGKIKHIGITSHNLGVLEKAVADEHFDTIMVCFSFLEPLAAEKVIPEAGKRNIGVIAMKPFSGGVITNANLALKYVLSQPKVLSIPGVEYKNLFDENWNIFRNYQPLNAHELEEIAVIQKAQDKIFCRRCDYCQPCPENIFIQTILGLRALVGRMGKGSLSRGMFRDNIERARNCTDCRQCVARCPYQLPIPELIRENLAWLEQEMKL